MKVKRLIGLLLVIMTLNFMACNTDVKGKIDKLEGNAKTLLADSKYEEALRVYDKILEIKSNDSEIKAKLQSTKYEKESVIAYINFRTKLLDIRENRASKNNEELKSVINDVKNTLSEFDKIDTSIITGISTNIRNFKESKEYKGINETLVKANEAAIDMSTWDTSSSIYSAGIASVSVRWKDVINSNIDSLLSLKLVQK